MNGTRKCTKGFRHAAQRWCLAGSGWRPLFLIRRRFLRALPKAVKPTTVGLKLVYPVATPQRDVSLFGRCEPPNIVFVLSRRPHRRLPVERCTAWNAVRHASRPDPVKYEFSAAPLYSSLVSSDVLSMSCMPTFDMNYTLWRRVARNAFHSTLACRGRPPTCLDTHIFGFRRTHSGQTYIPLLLCSTQAGTTSDDPKTPSAGI